LAARRQSGSAIVRIRAPPFNPTRGQACFKAKNRFYRANPDLGRIFKSEFILQYLSEPELRGRIRRGLLKVEQLHALAPDVFYGRRGRINARELWEQMATRKRYRFLVNPFFEGSRRGKKTCRLVKLTHHLRH
jgi:hypothetical protein